MGINEPSVQATYEAMKAKLSKVVPDVELKIKAELVYAINQRKKEKDAIILGHNYMEPALFHTVPDFVGDSLELSRKAAQTNAGTIIFCGVRFMAETAKILNPTKNVLLPAKVAGCSLASSITAQDVRELKAQYPGAPVITYINTYADVKAETDICCTSGNAARVVSSLPNDVIIFLPDQYLGSNVAKECGRVFITAPTKVTPDMGKVMVGWSGKCEVHDQFTVEDIVQIRKQFPGVSVVTHPECSPEVVAASDISSSTSKMVTHVRDSNAPHFLILTECSMADNIIAENPDKDILRMCSIRCPHMNEITLEDTLRALEKNELQIDVDPEIARRAKGSLERMLAL